MTLKKRGLSRGLEALLKPDSLELKKPAQKARSLENDTKRGSGPSSLQEQARPNDLEISGQLFPESPAQSELMLLEEAEALKRLIEEFEQIIERL